MSQRRPWLGLAAAILITGTIPLSLWGYGQWSRWEVRAASEVATRVIAGFRAPCHAPAIDLRCDVPIAALPAGPYAFVVVDTMPFEGVFVVVRYDSGTDVALDVFPKLIGRSRVHLVSVSL
jgi:hypothetical protein